MGKPVETARQHLKPLSHSFTLDVGFGLQSYQDATRLLHALKARLARFALQLHPTKTRLIECGRFAMANRQRRGAGKPETFTFLGFRHICDRTRNGKYKLRRNTDKKRMRARRPGR